MRKINPPSAERLLRKKPKEIHNEPCENCSVHSAPDPEMEDVDQWIKDGADWRGFAFPCAWRTEKLCYSFKHYKDRGKQ